ncbi:MAG: SDR family NAD(P)-dependent oxidoreductase [Betaproteobacteria bacterium]
MAWLKPLNPPMIDWHGKSVWVIGASSGIGRATAAALHARGARVTVSARKAQALNDFVAEHPGSAALPLDSTDPQAVHQCARALIVAGAPDCVLYCAGHYRAMRASALDVTDMLRHLQVNYQGALYLLDALLPALRQRGSGHLAFVSSVAGYRGLPNSLAYGPTKAALTNLVEALYLDLQADGIAVSVINPGFVETPATAGNSFSMPGLITSAQAAQAILDGWARGKFEIHFPKRFTLWMKALRNMPNRWYFFLVRKTIL